VGNTRYGFLVDRQTREFVFAGVFGGHPHCGTANFSYDNSDGSGPSLFPSDFYEQGQNGEEEEEEENKEEVEVDPENAIETSTQAAKELIAAVKKRISEFCLNRYH
jgi:predicted  nucleic acid-binding Zn-ribbon protein